MAGKRLLDIAAIFHASRGVAEKHVALRSQQLDVHIRTSTLASAVRSQTDRVTETVRAASFLASRLNESERISESQVNPTSAREQVPRKETSAGTLCSNPQNRIDQDSAHEKLTANPAIDAGYKEDLEIKQESAKLYPLPDGTIAQNKQDLNEHLLHHDILSARTRAKATEAPLGTEMIVPTSSNASTIPLPSRDPLAAYKAGPHNGPRMLSKAAHTFDDSDKGSEEKDHINHRNDGKSTYTSPTNLSPPKIRIPIHTSNIQEAVPHFQERKINSDSYYDASNVAAIEQPSTGVKSDLFHSPRVARMLAEKGPVGRKTTNSDTSNRNGGLLFHATHEWKVTDSPSLQSIEVADQSSCQSFPKVQVDEEVKQSARDMTDQSTDTPKFTAHELRESKVPSSRLGRLWNYGGLAASMLGGAIGESLRRAGGRGGEGSYMLSEANMERLVSKLSRMRGAALKLGQVISFQDSKMIPAQIQQVLQRVQDRADYMPPSQRDKVLATNLGSDWRDMFSTFDDKPLAAASIGQVHSAVLRSNGAHVAVKVQYPGVAESIDSDLSNLALLLTASRLLPKGLFLDKTIANARVELAWECDYIREAESGRRFERLLADDRNIFRVPRVYGEASGKQVLTTEFMEGIGVTKDQNFTQEQKDWIGTHILRLCLREITEFRFMQTDPNWTNFLFNSKKKQLELLDFGASREYPETFITKYSQLLAAASRSDRDVVKALSIALGYLTGQESKAMIDAHILSILTLAEPFLDSSPEVYNFKDQTITDRVKELIPLMIRERLAPPPEETYSLHRKLSGAFLLCARLGSRVRCRELFESSMKRANIF
ncbi:putative ubiquinone biosynthesis protein coq-8 [Diplocarpon rosae]|nr:putative ubiquinone biosynthesis protein coq-8 [Diplocarpon rosae]